MKRRTLLRQLIWTSAGLLTVPAWARSWSPTSLEAAGGLFSREEEHLLGTLVQAIIPATDTPGARDLGVHQLVQKILEDCYEADVQALFSLGLKRVEEQAQVRFQKPFENLSPGDQLLLLSEMEKEEATPPPVEGQGGGTGRRAAPTFFRLLKELTILGYTNSEYVLTQVMPYVAVPGFYHGCAPYSSKKS